MLEIIAAAAVAAAVTETKAATTDFGVRVVSGNASAEPVTATAPRGARVDLQAAAVIGSRWGRVTSLRRTAARNRAVGGVRNSYHLVGRAIDIARRAGVRHADIAAAYRRAGFTLVESLDEGDHSHFAFGTAPSAPLKVETAAPAMENATKWKIVAAPSLASR